MGAGAAALALPGATSTARAAVRRSAVPPIRGPVIRRGAPGFLEAAHVYNERFDGVLPAFVARPLDAADVGTAVRWAIAGGVPLRARSGGHSYAGYSTRDGGMVLDLRNLRGVRVDDRAATATVGAGSQLVDVYSALAGHGLTVPAGSCPSVGIAGHALGGGMGLAARRWGLTTDNVLELHVVTADGRLRSVSAASDPDLHWALRGGGGGNFGVVTSFKLRVHETPPTVAPFFVSWPWAQASEALAAWLGWAPHAASELTSVFHLNAGAGTTSVSVSGQYIGSSANLPRLLAPLRAVAGASVSASDHGYLEAQLIFAGCASISMAACHTVGTRPGGTLARERFRAKSDYLAAPLPTVARDALVRAVEARAALPGSGAVLFDAYGGAIRHVAPDATAFVHRDALCCIQYLSYNGGRAWLSSTARTMRPYASGGAYVNYTDPELVDWRRAYYGSNYPRLLSIRREVDPYHYFSFPQAI